jgi:N-dimethylarginine dimethylaminohydrolase
VSIRIDSETGLLRDVLLCRPEHYEWLPISDIAQQSLSTGLSFDRDRALAQHASLIDTLRAASVQCHFIEPVPGLPDLCWTRDSSQVTPWGPAITRLSEAARREENQIVLNYFEQLSTPLWGNVVTGNIEGGDIHIIRPGLLVVGYSPGRTTETAARQFSLAFEDAGWETRLEPVQDRFVHLDVIFCMAATNLALVCTEAVSAEFPAWLSRQGIELVDVSIAEVSKLACNCLSLGDDRVVLAGRGLDVADHLRSKGIDVIELNLDMFTLAGGGVHCLTQPLRREPI